MHDAFSSMCAAFCPIAHFYFVLLSVTMVLFYFDAVQGLFCWLAFFGTGNVVSISSFQISSCYRFVTVFQPFLMSAILILKLFIPFALVSVAFSSIVQIRQTCVSDFPFVAILIASQPAHGRLLRHCRRDGRHVVDVLLFCEGRRELEGDWHEHRPLCRRERLHRDPHPFVRIRTCTNRC